MSELSDLAEEGKKFLFGVIDIDEKGLELLGKLRWLKADEKVASMEYSPEKGYAEVRLKEPITVADFTNFLERYQITSSVVKTGGIDRVKLFEASSGIDVYFQPVVFDRRNRVK